MQYIEFNTKKNRSKKNGDKDGEVFNKLMKNALLEYYTSKHHNTKNI